MSPVLPSLVLTLVLTLLLSALLCGVYLRLARRWRLLDTPNERSSHQLPTPHGGGTPLLLAFVAGLSVLGILQGGWPGEYVSLAIAALFLMLLGVVDDLRGLSVRLRFILYGLCCLAVAAAMLAPLFPAGPLLGGLLLLVTLAMLWFLNLYNFMDGIDGIAGIQCVLACTCAASLCWGVPDASQYMLFCLLLAASHLGFLVWNWPPAKLFMGDAGSVPTGFLLAALTLLGATRGLLHPACWLILLAVFVTDASWTLVWRVFSGQPFTQAHRLHAYQRLSRHWNSHRSVDLLLIGITLCWLFPLAWAVRIWPDWSATIVILAYLPLLWGMAKVYKLK